MTQLIVDSGQLRDTYPTMRAGSRLTHRHCAEQTVVLLGRTPLDHHDVEAPKAADFTALLPGLDHVLPTPP